jgi:hypothetical protein
MQTNTQIKFYRNVDGVVTIKANDIEIGIYALDRDADAHTFISNVMRNLCDRTYNIKINRYTGKDKHIVADTFNTGTHCIHKQGVNYYLLQTNI